MILNTSTKDFGRMRKELLGFIPVDVDAEADVDAETGQVESVKGPWRGFWRGDVFYPAIEPI